VHGNIPPTQQERLNITFDIDDIGGCVRFEGTVRREYRVKVTNNTGEFATNIRVKIESLQAPPEDFKARQLPLENFRGATLRVRHAKSSSTDLADGESEYFNLMEYHPDGLGSQGPVIFVTHMVQTLPDFIPEPPRVSRRPVNLSYATFAGRSSEA
jgi:hypothetical protein